MIHTDFRVGGPSRFVDGGVDSFYSTSDVDPSAVWEYAIPPYARGNQTVLTVDVDNADQAAGLFFDFAFDNQTSTTGSDVGGGGSDNTSLGTSSSTDVWKSTISLNYTLSTMVLVALLLFVVIVATAFGNLLVVVALFRYKYLRTVSNYLIGNLALSDFLLATTILPLSTVNECLGHWVFGRVVCNLWLIMDVLYCTASIWNLCVIAFDRFTATLYPVSPAARA